MEYKYTAYAQSRIMSGDIVEVGLGNGDIARTVMENDSVKSYTNYEMSPAVVDKFRGRNKNVNKKHKVVIKDFLKEKDRANKFDVALVDTLITRADYMKARPILLKLAKSLKKGGKIIVEYQADITEERDLRTFMEQKYGAMKTEFLNTGRLGDSRHVAYYEV